jgi:hypothetical protein
MHTATGPGYNPGAGTQPYLYPPPAKKNYVLPIVLGVVGGIALLAVVAVLVFMPRGQRNTADQGQGSAAVVSGANQGEAAGGSAPVVAGERPVKKTIEDYQGSWTIQTVDSVPVGGGGQLQEVWIEDDRLKLVYAGYNLTFSLSLLGDGSLQGEAYTAGGEVFLAQGVFDDAGRTLQIYMPAPEDPYDHLFEMTMTR